VAFINNHPEYKEVKGLIGEMTKEELMDIVTSGYFDKSISFENYKEALPSIPELVGTVVGQIFAPKIALGIVSKTLAGLYVLPVVAADIGTGSGCLAITLKLEEPKLKMYAGDISAEAIEQAKENAVKFGAEVEFFVGDLLEPIKAKGIKLDLLVCNPPYIPEDEELELSVKGFEPHVALFGGEDGLRFYKRVLQDASEIVNPGGMLGFEIGWNQREALTQLCTNFLPNDEVVVRKDINGKDRMLMVYRKK